MIEYLQSIYEKTRWPFFLVVDLKSKGIFNREEANLLITEGKIKKRQGMHGDLIELLYDPETP